MKLESASARLVVINSGRLFAGNRVGVSSERLASATPALLSVYPSQPFEEKRAVWLVPRREVPPKILVVGTQLGGELGLEGGRSPWQITTDGFEHLAVRELLLELAVEESLETAVSTLNRSDDLNGMLLWLGPSEEASALSIEIAGLTYRIRSLSPASYGQGTLFEIDDRTHLQLFAPSAKSGVDIVILADCSGSMEIADLTESPEQAGIVSFIGRLAGAGTRGLQRSEALRRALRNLLELRLSLAGRVSRIAVVAFTETSIVRFPRGGGMREMDEATPAAVVQEFRDAIGLLRSEGGTDIGQALHFAAELLVRHGHPANDRLIVLISDGAHWAKRDEATGEEMLATNEPVSLMRHLHRDMKIQLHAIGISNETLFRRWLAADPRNRGTDPHVSLIPNHALLEELVKVAGGDPSRTGDAQVLQDYFSGLGTGVTRTIILPKRNAPPEPSAAEIIALSHISRPLVAGDVPEGYFEKSEKLSAEIIDLYLNCNNYSTTQKRPAFVQTDHTLRALKALSDTKVGNADEFKNFILRIDQMFAKTRAKPRGAYAPDAIDEALNDPRLADLHAIRIVYADDTELPDHSPNSDNVEKRGEDRQISAFISYAHGDEALKTRFLQHLTALRREGLINVWHDRMLEPGQHLDSAIGTKLASADLVLLLLSPDFIDSNYCTEVEMQGAFARAKTGECEVATVILKPCQWKHIPIDGGRHLGDFLATPRDGKPVSEWPDHDTAFDDSVSSLRKLIQKKSPASSNTRSLSDERRASEALRRMVGVTHIDSDNVLGWAGLQAAVLNDIHSILTQLRRAYLDAGVTRQSTSDGSTFVWKD